MPPDEALTLQSLWPTATSWGRVHSGGAGIHGSAVRIFASSRVPNAPQCPMELVLPPLLNAHRWHVRAIRNGFLFASGGGVTAGSSLISVSKHVEILDDFLDAFAGGQSREDMLRGSGQHSIWATGHRRRRKDEGRGTKAERKATNPSKTPPTPPSSAIYIRRIFHF